MDMRNMSYFDLLSPIPIKNSPCTSQFRLNLKKTRKIFKAPKNNGES